MYDFHRFRSLYDQMTIKTSYLQNSFYADSSFSTQLREFCKEKEIVYQSFWTLTVNRRALNSHRAKEITPQTVMYAFMMALGHALIDSITDKEHMMEDVVIIERIRNGEEMLNTEDIVEISSILGL